MKKPITTCMLLAASMLCCAACTERTGATAKNGASNLADFARNTRIEDVMADPAFVPFGRLIFPVDRGYWSGETLEQLQLTWYSHINADKTAEVCNYMKRHVSMGERIFYDIYTEEEKAQDPQKRNTGLFFFRGKPNAPFAICNAGGGFAYVGAMHDSYPHALELVKQGYNAFALVYRPGAQTALEDLARAIMFIEDHAAELEVRPDGYSLWGGSAGARMAAALGNADNLRHLTGRTDIPSAAAVVMQYTGYAATSSADAPTYACVGTSDGIASWQTMRDRLQKLSSMGIDTEFHAYQGLPHGFGLGQGTVADGWLNDALRFWQKQLGTTGIRQNMTSEAKNDTIYNMEGVRQNTLQRGLNIVNGKKVVKQ